MLIYYNDGYDCNIYCDQDTGAVAVVYHGVELPQYLNKYKHPYPLVYIPNHGEACVHQLVAYAVYGVRQRNEVVNHKDNNPYNSYPDNLEYISQSENMKQARIQQRRTPIQMWKWEKDWKEITLNV